MIKSYTVKCFKTFKPKETNMPYDCISYEKKDRIGRTLVTKSLEAALSERDDDFT